MKKKIGFWFLWLSLVCIIAFIFQNLFPGFSEMFLLNKNALNGEYWRFLTAIFLHSDITHLLYNLFALLFFGFALERLIGTRRFLLVFFISGILANIIAVNFYDSSLGVSGAVYGIIGCLMIAKPFMLIWAFGLILPMFIAGILWIIGDILGVLGMGSGNIGNIAHLSGIGVGILYGIWIRMLTKKSVRKVTSFRFSIPDNYMKDWEEKHMK